MNGTKTDRRTAERVVRATRMLELLESHRLASGDTQLGSNIERMIIDRELKDLEAEIYKNPGPLLECLVPVNRPRKRHTSGS